jgi:antitoxin component YwqK of YwqJK toxin-antitoxin module
MISMRKFYALFFGLSLVFAFACSNQENKPENKTTDTSEIQTAQIQPNDKEIVYYENGQAQFMQQYLNGIKHGEYKDWYKTGQLRTVGYYNMGTRNGTWQWYGEKGEITLQVRYDKQVAQIN